MEILRIMIQMYTTRDKQKCKGENGVKMMGAGIGRRLGRKPGLPRLNGMFYPAEAEPPISFPQWVAWRGWISGGFILGEYSVILRKLGGG